jgi:hypothetical protein
MKRASLALVAVSIFTVVATSLYSQDQPQNQAPRPVRSRADETLAVLFSLKWRGGVSRYRVFRPSGGDFKGIDTTTRLSLSMVASPQCLLPFHPARSL